MPPCSPATMWPMATQAPHTDSRRESERDSRREQVKLQGWLLSSRLWTLTLNWSQNSGHWSLSWPCWGRLDFLHGFAEEKGFDMGSLPLFQIAQHLNKTTFLFHQELPLEFGFCGSRQMAPLFYLVTKELLTFLYTSNLSDKTTWKMHFFFFIHLAIVQQAGLGNCGFLFVAIPPWLRLQLPESLKCHFDPPFFMFKIIEMYLLIS